MSILIADAALAAALEQAEEPVEIETTDGRKLGLFLPRPEAAGSAGPWEGRSVRDVLAWIAANRMTPAPGTPDSTEMLREDRER